MIEEEFENVDSVVPWRGRGGGGGSNDVIEQRGMFFDVWIRDMGAVIETPSDQPLGGADLVDEVFGITGVGAAREKERDESAS